MDKKQQPTDKLLSKVYQQCDSTEQELKFLESVFDFLNRRSSYLSKPGASNKVIQMVHKHIDIAKKKELENQSLNQQKTNGITSNTKKSISEQEAKELEQQEKDKKEKKKEIKKEIKTEKESEKKQDVANKPMDIDQSGDESDDLSSAPPGNGGKTDKYVWTQSLSEVELSIEIDANLRAKHLKIVINKKRLFVAVKGKESTPIIDGELKAKVNVDDSTWTLDKESGKSTKTLTIILQKIKGMTWWDCVIIGDPKIDTSKIQPENSKLDQLDDETRQTVEKMMFDQRQKMKGLPTSKELEQQQILEKFKRQHPEMDFSKMKMAGGFQ